MSAKNFELAKSNGAEAKAAPESSELEPCMGDDKSRGGEFFKEFKTYAKKKTGLSDKGVYIALGVVIFAFSLCIVVIALACAWPSLPHKYSYPSCEGADCLRAAAQIQESLNSSISPCADLWGALCGGWLENNPLPKDRSVWNMKQQMTRKEAENIRNLIATMKLPLHSGTVEYKMKSLYDVCLDVHNIEMDDSRVLTSIISELGGWYILRNWNDADFDKNALLVKLHSRFGVSPYFKVTVEPHPHHPGQNTIVISPSGLGLPDKEFYYRDQDDRIQTAYKEYITDVVIYMSSARNEATKFGTDIFSYEKRIAEITPDRIDMQNPVTTYNFVSLSELKDIIPFYDILLAMFPKSNITENTEVIVTSLQYLKDVSQIIASTDRKTINGYLIWTLVRNNVPFLSEKYTSALLSFESELLGVRKPLERWELCAGLVKKFMGLAVNNFLQKNGVISKETSKIVNETFGHIKNAVKDRISIFEDTQFLYKHIKSKLKSLKLQTGLPNFAKEPKFLKNYYSNLNIIKTNFFESLENGIIFQKSLEQSRLSNSIQGGNFDLFGTDKVYYLPSENTVYVPGSLLVEPYFQNNYPTSIIYGRLGVEIAEEVLASVLPYENFWTSDGKILSPFQKTVEESKNSVQISLKCLKDYLLNLNLDIPYAAANETALRTLKHLLAVNVANEALLNALDTTKHIHIPSLEDYEDSALFFVSYAQTQCSNSTNQYQLFKNIVEFQLPQRTVLHLAWAQLREFSKAFECRNDKKVQCRDIF